MVLVQLVKLRLMLQCACDTSLLNSWFPEAITHPWQKIFLPSGQFFIAAPYSGVWYILNEPAKYGFTWFMIYLFMFDSLLMSLVFAEHSRKYLFLFTLSSLYFFNIDVADAWVFWLAVLGEYNPFFSIGALLVKVPWDAPSYVWGFILNNRFGFHEPDGLYRYSSLVAWWVFGLEAYIRGRNKPEGK
jgi:hypothetical protein